MYSGLRNPGIKPEVLHPTKESPVCSSDSCWDSGQTRDCCSQRPPASSGQQAVEEWWSCGPDCGPDPQVPKSVLGFHKRRLSLGQTTLPNYTTRTWHQHDSTQYHHFNRDSLGLFKTTSMIWRKGIQAVTCTTPSSFLFEIILKKKSEAGAAAH